MVVHSSLGDRDELPVSVFFRGEEDFFAFEAAAMELCRGRVLDLGAGVGAHALPLEERGLPVTAVELVPEAAEIMRERGVRRVVRGDLLEAASSALGLGRFDTVLMLMNGTGPLGTLEGLDRFLRLVPRVLAPGGHVLLDSAEPIVSAAGAPPPVSSEGAYPGEATIRLEYRGELAPPFRELYVDADTLARRAAEAGWLCEFPFREEGGAFLARLSAP